MAKGKKDPSKTEKKPRANTKKADEPQELRLTQLERVELNLCERDCELALKDIELANARIRNLTMDYHSKMSALKEQLKTAQVKSEQLVLIRNRKLAEIEHRLMQIEKGFSFTDYLEQEDGLLIRNDEKIGALDPTAGLSETGSDTVTA